MTGSKNPVRKVVKTAPSILGFFVGVAILLSPSAHADSPNTPTYDGEIANGNTAYSKTSESDGTGWVQKTYHTDSNGVRRLVEIKKYSQWSTGKAFPTYRWVSYSGRNGTTINQTDSFSNNGDTHTKEEIDKDGKTTYHWDGHHWKWVSYTKAESNGVRNALQTIGVGLDIGGVHIGHGDHEHARTLTDHKSPDKKRTATDKNHTDDRR